MDINTQPPTHLEQAASHGVRGLITLPLAPLLAFPYVTCLAPVVQPVPAHAVAREIAGRLLLTT